MESWCIKQFKANKNITIKALTWTVGYDTVTLCFYCTCTITLLSIKNILYWLTFLINNICHLQYYILFRLLEVFLTLHSTIIYILPKSAGLQASLQNVLLYEQSKCFKVSPEVRLLVMAILLLADIWLTNFCCCIFRRLQ